MTVPTGFQTRHI